MARVLFAVSADGKIICTTARVLFAVSADGEMYND